MKFLKQEELELKNGGYLYSTKGKSVYNKEFVDLQKEASFIFKLYEINEKNNHRLVRNRPIKGILTKEQMLEKASELAFKETAIEFITIPEEPNSSLKDQLKSEALEFIHHDEEVELITRVNKYMQRFNILVDFESHGLFFEKGQSKLNKIYTIAEITEAVQSVVHLLDK